MIMRILKNVSLILGSVALIGCASTKSYQDVGTYNGNNYVFDITWVDEGLFRTTYLSINDTEVLKMDRETVRAANCEKTSFYVSVCEYSTEYEGNSVEVVATQDSQMYQQNTYYSISFNGSLVERITVPLM